MGTRSGASRMRAEAAAPATTRLYYEGVLLFPDLQQVCSCVYRKACRLTRGKVHHCDRCDPR